METKGNYSPHLPDKSPAGILRHIRQFQYAAKSSLDNFDFADARRHLTGAITLSNELAKDLEQNSEQEE